jgi:fatty-acid desaturase
VTTVTSPRKVQVVVCETLVSAVNHSAKLQGIGIVVLVLLWFVLGIASLERASSDAAFLGRLAVQLVLLVAASLSILSWRTRHRSHHKPY